MAADARVLPEDFERFLDAVFHKLGMTPENAACCAADLVLTKKLDDLADRLDCSRLTVASAKPQ